MAATDTIPTTGTVDDAPSTLSTGTEGYVLDCNLTTDSATAGTGTVTIDPEYNGTTTSQGGTQATTFQEVATANGPTDNDVVTLVPRVAIYDVDSMKVVYARNNRKYEVRQIAIGASSMKESVVTNGLNRGEVISLIKPPLSHIRGKSLLPDSIQ